MPGNGNVDLDVSLEGVEGLQAALADAVGKVRASAERAIGDETDAVADDMRAGAPVYEGVLRDSIVASHEGMSGTAEATARHAPFVEYGTSKDPAQPFAEPAAETSRGRLPDRLADAIGGDL